MAPTQTSWSRNGITVEWLVPLHMPVPFIKCTDAQSIKYTLMQGRGRAMFKIHIAKQTSLCQHWLSRCPVTREPMVKEWGISSKEKAGDPMLNALKSSPRRDHRHPHRCHPLSSFQRRPWGLFNIALTCSNSSKLRSVEKPQKNLVMRVKRQPPALESIPSNPTPHRKGHAHEEC